MTLAVSGSTDRYFGADNSPRINCGAFCYYSRLARLETHVLDNLSSPISLTDAASVQVDRRNHCVGI